MSNRVQKMINMNTCDNHMTMKQVFSIYKQ